MSRFSAPHPVTGQDESITWKRRRTDTVVYVGETPIGQLFHMHNGSWTAVSVVKNPHGFRMVSGFRRRWNATNYLLRACGSYTESQ